MEKRVSVKAFGAWGDNLHDDYEAIQQALDSGAEEIIIPQGIYCISGTLRVGSNTHICASQGAKLVMKSQARRHRNEFLLTNADTEGGNVNIRITGGIWDGNNQAEQNKKPDDLFEPDGYSGVVLNFAHVNGLVLEHMVIANPATYYVRMSWLEHFVIEDISFLSDRLGWNQDGLHFGGNVRHGCVRDVRALSYGQTNDDMIALNADDSIERIENRDICRAGIEDISFENIFAENCHCIIRMCSITAPIRNIRFKNVYGGYRHYAINGDAARYCRTPLFKEEEYPEGVGCIEHVDIENFQCYPVKTPLASWEGTKGNCSIGLMLEEKIEDFHISGFRFWQAEEGEACIAMQMRHVPGARIVADGREYVTGDKTDVVRIENVQEITISRREDCAGPADAAQKE